MTMLMGRVATHIGQRTALTPESKRKRPMPRTIEIKARIESVESITPKAAAIAKAGPIEIAPPGSTVGANIGHIKDWIKEPMKRYTIPNWQVITAFGIE